MDAHRSGRRRLFTAAATALLLLLATSCSGHTSPAAAPTRSTGTAASSAPAALPGYQSVGAGVLVDSSLPAGTTARVDSNGRAPFPAFTSASDVFEVHVAQEPSAPAKIVLPLRTGTALAGQVPVVLVSETGTGDWQPLATSVVAGGGAVQATTPHFSFFTTLLVPLQDLISAAKDLFDSATSGVVAEAAAPRCDQEAAARQGEWAVTSKGPDTVKWCFGLDADGHHQVTVVNNRRYPLDIAHPGATLLHAGPRDLTDAAHYVPVPKGEVLRFPRDEATFTMTGPARFQTEFDGFAQSVYALQVGSETAVSTLNKFGLAKGLKAAKVADTLMSGSKCALTLGHVDGGEILKNCFNDPARLLAAFGAKGLFLAAVMTAGGLVQFFHSELNALGDQFNSRDSYRITVTSGTSGPLTLSSVRALATAGTPVSAAELAGYHQIYFTPSANSSDTDLAFSSPSGNVVCLVTVYSDVNVFCQATKHTYTDPPDPGCYQVDWDTGAVVMEHSPSRDKASLGFCTGGVLVPDRAQVLPYGRSVSFGGASCSSSERGIACRYAGMATFLASSEAFASRG